MSELSFDIKTSVDFYKKLLADHEEFSNDRTSSRVALNCAMTAWHLTEWTYHEFKPVLSNIHSTLGHYQQGLKNDCPSLQIMHDLANGTKHYQLKRHKSVVKATDLHLGDFSNDFSRDFDISSLDIELNDGSKIYFEDEIETVISFWTIYLRDILNQTL